MPPSSRVGSRFPCLAIAANFVHPEIPPGHPTFQIGNVIPHAIRECLSQHVSSSLPPMQRQPCALRNILGMKILCILRLPWPLLPRSLRLKEWPSNSS
jgi:hypothetical protein